MEPVPKPSNFELGKTVLRLEDKQKALSAMGSKKRKGAASGSRCIFWFDVSIGVIVIVGVVIASTTPGVALSSSSSSAAQPPQKRARQANVPRLPLFRDEVPNRPAVYNYTHTLPARPANSDVWQRNMHRLGLMIHMFQSQDAVCGGLFTQIFGTKAYRLVQSAG